MGRNAELCSAAEGAPAPPLGHQPMGHGSDGTWAWWDSWGTQPDQPVLLELGSLP